MKKAVLISFLPVLLLCSFNSPTLKASSSFQGKAYDSSSKLDFTDSTDSEIAAYYGNQSGKSGSTLMTSLYDVISVSNTYVTYSNVTDWYKITDRNWDLSQTIDPDSYKFTLDTGGNYFETMLYFADNTTKTKAINTDINKSTYTIDSSKNYIDWTNKTKPNSNIQVDKEHVWVKSHGFSPSGNPCRGAGTDLHHLIAADHHTNNVHSDKFYGNVANHDSAKKVYCYYGDGTTEVSGWIGKTEKGEDAFEPTDKWKGDIARALFYMATRFSKKLDTNTEAEPYLLLTDDNTLTDDDSHYHGVFHNLSDFLTWNALDPVDNYEKHRNNLIYKNVQNNRNPYVDHPEWVNKVFGDDTSSDDTDFTFSNLKSSYNMHVGTPLTLNLNIPESKENTKYKLSEIAYDENLISFDYKTGLLTPKANGTTILSFKLDPVDTTSSLSSTTYSSTINVKEAVSLSGLASTQGDLIINVNEGSTYQLNVTANNSFDDESLAYESSDTNIATVSDTGLITGVKNGSATISIYLSGDSKTKLASLKLNVTLNKNQKYILIIIAAAVLIVLIFLLFFFIIHHNNKKAKRSKDINYYSKNMSSSKTKNKSKKLSNKKRK